MWFRTTSATASSLGVLALLTYASHPGRDMFTGLWLLMAALVVGVTQFAAALLTLGVPTLRQHRRLAGGLLVLWVASGVCSRTLIPLRARVLLSEPWLRPEAMRLLAGLPGLTEPQVLGLFRIEEDGNVNGVAYLSTGSYSMFGVAGLVYAPQGPRPGFGGVEPSFDHLYGPWWRYSLVAD